MGIAKVLVNLSLDRGFDYLIPEKLSAEISVGMQVLVPFGHSVRSGFVVEIDENSQFDGNLKEIHAISGNRTKLPAKLVELGEWMAGYYCASRESAIRSLLPGAVRQGKVKEKTVKLFSIIENSALDEPKQPKQKKVLNILRQETELPLDAVTALAGCGASVVHALLKKGYLQTREAAFYRNIFIDEILTTKPLTPNPSQQMALDSFDKMGADPSTPKVMLLFGVTNSGKTEVYLQSIAKVLEEGKSAIVLVPEISLTPQTVRRFRARFGEQVSVLHSRLSEGERFDQWNKIRRNEVSIAVGARSALFAPFENLGLIIVDEEHESSYKQSESPRYHARDVAVMRGKMENARVILGSATPSFESYRNAVDGKYLLARMNKAAGNAVKPIISVVDLRLVRGGTEEGTPKSGLFSPILVNAVRERLRRAEQTILFLNRRGFARQMMCEDCGCVPGCPDCSVSSDRPAALTYHKREDILSCHMCGITMSAPKTCPQCGSESIRLSGSGTEKIENIARAIFPDARIARMDADTTRGADGHERILNALQRGEIDILIGTQMIAKGLHFPNITLVGVINADQILNLPDFRSAERTFGLITQVAGRAGRGDTPGEVIIQTFSPNNDTIVLAERGDFEGFYQYDMNVRELLSYPPCSHVIVAHFRCEEQQRCAEYAGRCFEELRPLLNDSVNAVAPMPAPVERIKGKFRYQIMIRGTKLKRIREKLREIALRKNGKVEIYIDSDPQSLM